MKTKSSQLHIALALLAGAIHIFAQGAAFTYQGQLSNAGSPASGLYDFRFKLYTDPFGNFQVGSSYLTNSVPTTNGLFTTTIDFGAGIFIGTTNWLEVGVRTNGGGAYTILNPLQNLTPTPYAIFAETASNLSGTVASANLSGTYGNAVNLNNAGNNFNGSFIGNGSGLMNLNAWGLSGNSGTAPGLNFLGTADNQPVIVKVNGQEAERFEPTTDTPNVIGGFSGNYVQPGLPGVTIGGGGTGLGNQPNIVTNNGFYATIAGGYDNTVTNYGGAILGGSVNFAGGNFTVIGGGQFHTSLGDYSMIGGGYNNITQSNTLYSTIGGGQFNLIQVNAYGSAIGGGGQNQIQSNAFYSTIGGGAGNQIQTNAYESTIGGGVFNQIQSDARLSTIGGGTSSVIQTNSHYSTIGGGFFNIIQSGDNNATIGGGANNLIFANTFNGTIGGGLDNFVNGISSTVAGGEQNQAGAFRDTVGGGLLNQASGGISTVAGGWTNVASGNSSAIGGGDHNLASALLAVISGGTGNQATNAFATVPGGENNVAGGNFSFAAGFGAQALHQGAFVWADSQGGTFSSTTNDEFSIRAQNGVHIQTDKGIHLNAADRPIIVRDWDVFATNAPGYKTGIGRWGLFMEPLTLTIGIPSNDVAPRYFQVAKYSTNGAYTTLMQVDQSGNIVAKGTVTANGVLLTSDRAAKENFMALDGKMILARVAALPVTEWNYKTDSKSLQHIGPMAQDFQAAFHLDGADDKHISMVDEGGVALAAIQGLNQKLNEKDAEIQTLEMKLTALQAVVTQLAAQK